MKKIDYDREFCDQADQVIADMDEKKMKECNDVFGKLTELYKAREQSLSKIGKTFSSSRASENPTAITTTTSSPLSMSATGRALKQREICSLSKFQFEASAYQRFDFGGARKFVREFLDGRSLLSKFGVAPVSTGPSKTEPAVR